MPGAILGTEDEAEEKKIVVVIVKPWLLWGLHPSWGRQVHTNRMNGHLWCWCSGVGGNMGTGGLPLTFPSDSPRFAHRWSAVSLNGCLSAHCLPHQDAEDTLLQRNSTVLSPFPSPLISSSFLFLLLSLWLSPCLIKIVSKLPLEISGGVRGNWSKENRT